MQYAVDYEHRSSDKMDRLSVINAFVDHVPKVPAHKVRGPAWGAAACIQSVSQAISAWIMFLSHHCQSSGL